MRKQVLLPSWTPIAALTLLYVVVGVGGYTTNAALLWQVFIAAVAVALVALAVAERRRLTTALHQGEQQFRAEYQRAEESQRWLATIVESSSDAILSQTPDGIILSWNQAAEHIYGYSAAEAVGQPISMLVSPECTDEEQHFLERLRQGERILHHETECVRKDGKRIYVSLTISPIKDAVGTIRGASVIARDITDRKRVEERIRYLAQHDTLTGLPNRILFRDRIGQAIAHAQRNQRMVAVLFLDLDGFKHINDSLGHQVGDRLLRMTARRLQRCLRDGDSVARLGGDEFVVCLPNLLENDDARHIAEKLLVALRDSFFIEHDELHISGSIGISLYPADGLDAEVLMRAADTAMYHAKEKGRNNFQYFTPHLNKAAERRLVIANRLHNALERGELTLEYQPQVELGSGRIYAAEALLRWRQADLGKISTSEFIKIAEETGLIVPIGEWVLRQACLQLRTWRDAGARDLRIAVNLSPQQFRRVGLPELAASVLQESGLTADALEMEITEGVLMTQSLENFAVLEQLAKAGVRLAIDDFGTGYSSLAYLQRFPIDTLKIDQSFVPGIGRDANDTAIVSAVIAMAHSLHLKVVAEGVETAEQAAFLKARSCDGAQGFYYSEPVSAEAFGAMLGQRATLASVY
ncbi:MAG: EAL domain-containing protein [Gammaproteobacteria bacterium]|nr:EAL domain-containing protein [Gammaproteobacteria bacterium]